MYLCGPGTRFSISSFVVLDLLFLALVCDLKLEAGRTGQKRKGKKHWFLDTLKRFFCRCRGDSKSDDAFFHFDTICSYRKTD